MILEIYLSLFGLAVVFIFLGFLLNGRADIFHFTGFIFIFILGLMLIPINPFGNVEYRTGSNITTNGANTTIQDIYTQFDNIRLGIYIATLGGLGFASSFSMRKGDQEFEEE
jgi:hypothetical protein